MSVKKIDFNSVIQSKKSFTTNFNEVIQNIHDGFTLGVYIYLSSLPPNWNVNVKQLMIHFDTGRDKIKRTLSWLNDKELIIYIRPRNEDGTFRKDTVDNFNNCAIEVQEGLKFIEKIKSNQQHISTHPETSIMDKSLYKNQSTRLKIQRLDNPASGKSAPINKIINKKTNRERKAKNQNPLSGFLKFNPTEANKRMCNDLGLSLKEEMNSFENRHHGKKTSYEFERWMKSSFDYKKKKPPLRIVENNGPKQTAQFWGPGHPSYDTLYERTGNR